MNDEPIWEMVAFLRKLPALSPEEYRAEVNGSPGHAHVGMDSEAGCDTQGRGAKPPDAAEQMRGAKVGNHPDGHDHALDSTS